MVDVRALTQAQNQTLRNTAKKFGVAKGEVPKGAILFAVDRDTREILAPVPDNSTQNLKAEGRVAINRANEIPVHKVVASKYSIKNKKGVTVDIERVGYWRYFAGSSPRKAARGVNRKGVPGDLHTFMVAAIVAQLGHLGYVVEVEKRYTAPRYSERFNRVRNTTRDRKWFTCDVKASIDDITLWFEVVDSSDYLDAENKNKNKMLRSITGGNIVYRVDSGRKGGRVCFDHLVVAKEAWDETKNEGALRHIGRLLLTEARYTTEVPTHAQKQRAENDYDTRRPTRLEIHQGGKPAGNPTANNTKSREGVRGDKYGGAPKYDDRRS